MTECKKCGKCCDRGDFWYLSKHPLIVLFYAKSKPQKEEGKCIMLSISNECLIEKYLGRDAKPDVCKEYECGNEFPEVKK